MFNKTILGMFVLAVAVSSSIVEAGACERGLRKGQRAVQTMWKNLGEDCDEIWGLGSSARRMMNRRYRTRRGASWRRRERNRCARIGGESMIEQYEKECLEDSSQQCTDMAEAAAEEIVFRNICTPKLDEVDATIMVSRPNYKKACRNAAIDSCPGLIISTANRHCRNEVRGLKTSKLRALQDLCGDTVNDMLGDN